MAAVAYEIGFDQAVLDEFDERTLSRGAGYWNSGRVLDLQVDIDGMGVAAAVRGSEHEPYEVEIIVDPKRGGYRIEGLCSCPVGFNCKHVVAALHAALATGGRSDGGNRAGGRTEAGSRPIQPSTLQTNERQLAAWLTDLAVTANETDADEAAPEHVRYILSPSDHVGRTPSLNPVLVRTKKRGGLSIVRKLTLSGLAYSTARGVTGDDRLLAQQAQSDDSYGFRPNNDLPEDHSLAAILLQRLLASERLHWQTVDASPLQLGPSRPAAIVWQLDDRGLQVPVLSILEDGAGGVDGAQLLDLNGACPWYVDPGRGCCGPLDPPAPVAMVRKLLRAPPLDPVAASLAAQRLRILMPKLVGEGESAGRLQLPTTTVEVETDDRPPLARLTLVTHQAPRGPVGRFQPGPADRAYLVFDYDGQCVAGVGGPSQFRRTEKGRLTIRPRRPDFEDAAFRRLFAAGFRFATPMPSVGKSDHRPPGLALFAAYGQSEAVWLPFISRIVPQLQTEGWQVETAPDFRWRLAEVDAWDGGAEPAGAGWFDLDIGIQVEGQRVPLLPLLLKVLGQDTDPEALLAQDPSAVLYALLPDGRNVALPVARIAPLTRILLDLFGGAGTLDAAGRARIDLGQAALLDGQPGLSLPALLQPEQRASLRRLLEPVDEAPPPSGLTTDLRPYQRRGLAWLQALDAAGIGGVLADDMGLGKTLQMVAFLQALKNEGRLLRPALVLAPTSVAPNWLREGAHHAPDLRIHLHQGPDRASRWDAAAEADLVVTSYPLLWRDHALLAAKPWSALILDEAQAVKNQAGKLASLVRTLPADRRFCVTGTPLENHLGELWTQMDFVMPGLLGDSRGFTRMFRTPIEKRGDGERRKQLAGRLRPFILRRSKGEVAADLPPKTEILERIPLGDDQRDLYETLRLAMDAKVRAAIAERGLARSHIVILEALLRLRQACCDPALLPEGRSGSAKVVSAKRAHLMQMLPGMVEEGRRILLFSQFTKMLDLIRADLDAAGLRHVSLVGDTIDRMAPVDRFQAEEAEIFLISLKAGGTGLTLTAADTVIHYDPWWNPAVEDQATDRAHRIGQDKPVFVYKLVADGTVEDRMLELQARKRQLATLIHDAGADNAGALSADDIDRLFAPI
jgi:hypothetical protein